MKSEKKSKKRLFITISVVLCCMWLWFNYLSIKCEKENRFRTFLMQNINDGIMKYHEEHNEYPLNLLAVDVPQRMMIEEYVQSGVYWYSCDSSGKKWYKLVCRFSGLMTKGNGKHGISWSGLQYSNNIDLLDLMPGVYSQPDKNGFYSVDLH